LASACAHLDRAPPVDRPPLTVVRAPAMIELFSLVDRVAQTDISVLITGETGVGKEVVADHLWRVSARAAKPMVRLNCAALSETLLESELFGHERGAFTGAIRAKPGLLESAEGGVVFLDEVGELPATTQAKLLRVIEERRVLRVGALRPSDLDVRFVTATHRDLDEEVAAKRFREDLFYRINGFSLRVPPLRERLEEIEPLARAVVAEFCRRYRRSREPEVSAAALEVMRAYRWPGNVRELRNVVERALVLSGEHDIGPEHLPLERMVPSRAASVATLVPPPSIDAEMPAEDEEHARILATLAQCAGNQTRAAKLLNMSRATLVARLERYGVRRPRK
jgi:DNA-binding NtrC family response regulator